MKWASIGPLLECRGDAIITWFERDAWRMRGVALSSGKHARGNSDRLTELLGSEKWMSARGSSELTELFVNRVLDETNKIGAECIDIRNDEGVRYKMILFVGKFKNAKRLAKEWKNNLERRLRSQEGFNISKILDVKCGRNTNLNDFINKREGEDRL